jgi:type IV pilus assembly protein PilC
MSDTNQAKHNRKQLSAEELFAFSDEMGMMITGGISALEGITLMLEESDRKEEKELLSEMQDTIYATNSFAAAVEETGVFPEYYIYMVRMGEQTGKTDEVLASLSRHYQREYEIYQAIRSAVSYPLLMVTMMLVIIIVLVTKIMPIFARVFEQLGSSMSGISGGLLAVGNFISRYSVIFLVVLLVLIAIGWYLAGTDGGRVHLKQIGYHIKSIRKISDKIAVSRFASGMSMTIGSGMDMVQAVDLAGELVKTPDFGVKLEKCKTELRDSMDIGAAFSASGIFNGLYGRMAVLAAKTGNLEQVMEKIADTYQEEADDEIHDLISVVEPTLVIVLSVIVGLILLSVMLPLLSIMTGLS